MNTLLNTKTYTEIKLPTKWFLDQIRVGDYVKINSWKRPMRVRAVSKNYLVMTQKFFGAQYYSVVEKKPRKGGNHNDMREGMFHCGPDFWIFGGAFSYKFDDPTENAAYLKSFEDGKTQLSERRSVHIRKIFVKRGSDES